MNITVFCSSSDAVDACFFEVARALGRRIAERGDTLVYGGAHVGLMGALARSAREAGGRIVGVIPKYLVDRGIAFDGADELIATANLRERKTLMEEKADAFIVLPGGFGTLEETVEIITLKQLHQHQKPIVILNANGFYDPLHTLFEHFYEQHFAKAAARVVYQFAESVEDALTYLDSYVPVAAPVKWVETSTMADGRSSK